MMVTGVMAAVGAVGIGFYLRFLVALCKDSKRGIARYWVRLRNQPDEDAEANLDEADEPVTRVA